MPRAKRRKPRAIGRYGLTAADLRRFRVPCPGPGCGGARTCRQGDDVGYSWMCHDCDHEWGWHLRNGREVTREEFEARHEAERKRNRR